jgi:hypothetical protein
MESISMGSDSIDFTFTALSLLDFKSIESDPIDFPIDFIHGLRFESSYRKIISIW